MANSTFSTKFPFAALPMKWFRTKELRARANRSVVEAIAWDCISEFLFELWMDLLDLFSVSHTLVHCERSWISCGLKQVISLID